MANKKLAPQPTAKTPHPGGAPTKYRPEYCQMLIDHMGTGLSYEAFAGTLSITKQTLYNWEKENKEFFDAKEIGLQKNRLWWEKVGNENIINHSSPLGSTSLNSTVYIFNLKNRFPQEWRDRHEVTQINAETIKLPESVVQATVASAVQAEKDRLANG